MTHLTGIDPCITILTVHLLCYIQSLISSLLQNYIVWKLNKKEKQIM